MSEHIAWMENNPGFEMKMFELADLASKSFTRAVKPSNIKANFRRIGIWPLNYVPFMHDTSRS